ncbi:MAG: hypothetical protein AAF251_11410 [Pseudomonadota bacterium]
MRLSQPILASVAAVSIASCSPQAHAHKLDSKNDAHCAALGYVFAMAAEEANGPRAGKRFKVLYQWYLDRMKKASDPPMTQTDLRVWLLPVVQSITGEPEDYTQTATACASRAQSDPGFDRYRRRVERQL